ERGAVQNQVPLRASTILFLAARESMEHSEAASVCVDMKHGAVTFTIVIGSSVQSAARQAHTSPRSGSAVVHVVNNAIIRCIRGDLEHRTAVGKRSRYAAPKCRAVQRVAQQHQLSKYPPPIGYISKQVKRGKTAAVGIHFEHRA